MKKVLLMMALVSILCCGCSQPPADTGILNYEEKDKEFGQYQDEEKEREDGFVEYQSDLQDIQACVEHYAEMMVLQDAKGCTDSFHDSVINAIMRAQRCDRDEAKEKVETKIKSNFKRISDDYRHLAAIWEEHEAQITIDRVDRYYQENELLDMYSANKIYVLDAVEVEFTITVGDKYQLAEARLIKFADGTWTIDANYLGI